MAWSTVSHEWLPVRDGSGRVLFDDFRPAEIYVDVAATRSLADEFVRLGVGVETVVLSFEEVDSLIASLVRAKTADGFGDQRREAFGFVECSAA